MCGASSCLDGAHFLNGGAGGKLLGEKLLPEPPSLAMASVSSTGAVEVSAGTDDLPSDGAETLMYAMVRSPNLNKELLALTLGRLGHPRALALSVLA